MHVKVKRIARCTAATRPAREQNASIRTTASRDCACAGTKVSDHEFDAESVAHVDDWAARSAYQSAEVGKEVAVFLPAALAIIQRLRVKGQLDLRHFLLASPSYPEGTVHTAKRHMSAAKDANNFVFYGFDDTLTCMLRMSLNEPHVGTVQELEATVVACMRWDCLKWVMIWVSDKNPMGNLIQLEKEMEKNEGVRVLVRKAEECVKDLIGALVWWDSEGQLL